MNTPPLPPERPPEKRESPQIRGANSGNKAKSERRKNILQKPARQALHETKLPQYTIACDGACTRPNGPTSWGFTSSGLDGVVLEGAGSLSCGTCNIGELLGAIHALEAVPAGSRVQLLSDSRYVVDGLRSWIAKWKKGGWRTKKRQPVANRELWERLDAARNRHVVTPVWVRGHSGHSLNGRAHSLATRELQERREAA